ncbi:MAG: hypothetical protein ACRBBO_13300 [Cognatishimia sp.]
MKRSLLTLATVTTATPALAHVDGHFHTHGIENALVLALVAAATVFMVFRR